MHWHLVQLLLQIGQQDVGLCSHGVTQDGWLLGHISALCAKQGQKLQSTLNVDLTKVQKQLGGVRGVMI